MENLRLLKFIEDEITHRKTNKEIAFIKSMTDEELSTLKENLIKERDKEYKKCGWLK